MAAEALLETAVKRVPALDAAADDHAQRTPRQRALQLPLVRAYRSRPISVHAVLRDESSRPCRPEVPPPLLAVSSLGPLRSVQQPGQLDRRAPAGDAT